MSLGIVLVGWQRCCFLRFLYFWRFFSGFSVGRFRVGFCCCCCGLIRLVLGFPGCCSCSFGCVPRDYFARGMAWIYALYNRPLFLFLSLFVFPAPFPKRKNKQKLIIAIACSRDELFCYCSSVLIPFSDHRPCFLTPYSRYGRSFFSSRIRVFFLACLVSLSSVYSFLLRLFQFSSKRFPLPSFPGAISAFPWSPLHLLVLFMTMEGSR